MTTRRVGRLPDDLTSFVGRRGAITQVKRLVSASRLVTLTGVAGVGKSRLAMRVARDLRRAFPDGIWLVELGKVLPRDDLAQVLVTSLGLELSDLPPEAVLAEQLADKRMLILLDGCEHLLDECGPLVGDLLAAAPEVRVLATSRAPLALAAERVWPVLPMVMPRLDRDGHVVQRATGFEVLELFADRASAVLPGFAIDPANEALVVRLCRQLDGLPLAIELAAVWMRSLSVEEILNRLSDRYRLLTLGDRSGLPHHRTLRAAVEWSFDLCSPTEQAVWARLSVFAGGFELDAAEAVCVGDGVTVEDVFIGVAGLVEKSVLVKDDDQPGARTRYRLLKTIQEYGRGRLGGGVKELALRRRHRDHFLLLAEHVDAEWLGPHQVEWLTRLRQDRSNLRAALDFCRAEPGEEHEGLRMAAALRFFWAADGSLREGRYWLDEMLRAVSEPDQQRARALTVNGLVSAMQGDIEAARALLSEARDAARRAEYGSVLALIAHITGFVDLLRNENQAATSRLAEALERREMLQHDGVALLSLPNLALLAVFRGDCERAVELCEECREICEEHGELWGRSWAELVLGLARWRQGDFPGALEHVHECLRMKQLFDDVPGILMAIELEAWVSAVQGRVARAARLSSAVAHLWRPLGRYLFGLERYLAWHAEADARIRNALPTAELRAARTRGAEYTLDELIRFALGERPPAPSEEALVRLTPREREVARLVAQGLSNRQIAEQLVISKRTSDSHIEHILAKLGATSRAQIAVWVAEQP
ncbi:non-specific serine/threonine protein kinase [Saccharopolyspora shandongensis]|uniref:Non-specific serine/threonine protein kinase n=1 Tax=Saccharopolyspora shandongensis TaxID=418495 RepID=A0A1H2YEE3_9PSEU|nr:LuxR C-terminal-related transcriptional regulator [Saccharopolyspora shandongensis]SDX03572.1 non-specific serine/threonine protein kinase [Saccharopolyspora shandongensis]